MVPLAQIPKQLVNAVLAIEDRRFYEHPGIDPIRIVGALVSNLFGDRLYSGASTITQQLARNFFLTDQMEIEQATGRRSLAAYRRKLKEQFMSIVLEGRATKDEILELYLNDVYLGQRGSFAIHGVAEASRLIFGKDVANVTLSEGAMIAGVIQTARHSPFRDTARAKERRNTVLRAMADAGYVSTEAAERASLEPVAIAPRALDSEAPYFVDYIGQEIQAWRPDLARGDKPVDVYTTLDLHLQRIAEDVMRDGLVPVDKVLARRKRPPAQSALIAADPRTGDILALVGGRSYNQSQFNRAVTARRQPGSVFKPFVYLAAFERAAELARTDLTPATLVWDEPSEFLFEDQPPYAPGELRGGIRRRDHAPPRAGPLPQHRRGESGGKHRLRSGGVALEEDRRGHPAEAVSVDRARRLRGDAARDRHGLYAVRQRRRDAAAARDRQGRRRRQGSRAPAGPDEADRPRGHDVSRHEHDAERAERRHRLRRARRRLRAGRRRQVRNDQRPPRRLVRRLHAGAPDGRLGRPRRQPAHRPQRDPGGAADLDRRS